MRGRAQRLACDALLLAIVALAATAIAADVAVLRPVAVALALLLVPGGAALTLLRVDDLGAAAGVAIGLSIALATLLASALAVAGALDPWTLGAALGVPATTLLMVDLARAALSADPDPASA